MFCGLSYFATVVNTHKPGHRNIKTTRHYTTILDMKEIPDMRI